MYFTETHHQVIMLNEESISHAELQDGLTSILLFPSDHE